MDTVVKKLSLIHISITLYLVFKPDAEIWWAIVFSAGFALACVIGAIIDDKLK